MEPTTTPKIAAVYNNSSKSQHFTTLSSEEASLNGKYTRPLVLPPPIPFAFANQRIRIDWRMLHGVDIRKLILSTDVQVLDELVPAIAFGDLEAEDPMTLTETNFVKIFRLSQLIIEYLLYVQDTLSTQCSFYQEERYTLHQSIENFHYETKILPNTPPHVFEVTCPKLFSHPGVLHSFKGANWKAFVSMSSQTA
ncbi:hypothetical protein BSKO_08297 [Bryopsis sp. KO-2023]|nr:hypothetical protein BSKO_08297 [Bryopsis sp. KO-2023]